MCKGITIDLDIANIDDSVLHDMKVIFDKHIGTHTLNMNIFDREEGVQLELLSKKYKVEASNELLTDLRGISAVEKIKVNANQDRAPAPVDSKPKFFKKKED
jgi:hypothetical protein